MVEPIKIELSIPSLSDYVGVARLAASGIANRMKFTHEDIEDIKIAVSEACTNAVQYAYGDKIGEIKIIFLIHDDFLEIKVVDHGRGFEVNEQSENNLSDPDKIGLGLGIVFMRSLMDKVTHTSTPDKGTEVIMIKKLPVKND
ncbi:MAG: ATP-binding protein [Candidatus Margulisbacteria bacterium]|nr:ATP-binding protein [Candidatus Margulisiibacteriota bacterium]